MINSVNFKIHADNQERAAKFYNGVFGWVVNRNTNAKDFWLLKTNNVKNPGINGGLIKRNTPCSSPYYTIDVPSVDEYIKKIVNAGGKVIAPKMLIPGGYIAYCQDTEGNVFGLFQKDI